MDAGLEKVVAAETVLSDVQGANGRLIIRGRDVEDSPQFDLRAHRDPSVVRASSSNVPRDLQPALGAARIAAFHRLSPDFARMASLPETEALRAALSLMSDGDDLHAAIDLAATMAVASQRRHRTPEVLAAGRGSNPNAAAPHDADLLRMIRARRAHRCGSPTHGASLVTICDHGLNASTFVARCVASTRAGLGSAVIAGLSALKGPLHGGAPGPVLDMLDGIGSDDTAETWIRDALDRGERLMGFGHRVYRTRDPRADVLKRVVAGLPASHGRLALAQTIEGRILQRLAAGEPDRKLDTNVEYYTAILLEGARRAAWSSPALSLVAASPAGLRTRVSNWPRAGSCASRRQAYVGPLPAIAA